jgi:hypothetical protein
MNWNATYEPWNSIAARFAEASHGRPKIPSGTSGAFRAPSTTTKPPRSVTEPTSVVTVCGSPQPAAAALLTP